MAALNIGAGLSASNPFSLTKVFKASHDDVQLAGLRRMTDCEVVAGVEDTMSRILNGDLEFDGTETLRQNELGSDLLMFREPGSEDRFRWLDGERLNYLRRNFPGRFEELRDSIPEQFHQMMDDMMRDPANQPGFNCSPVV